MSLLKKMAAHLPQVIAVSDGRVVGYNLAMTAFMRDEMPRLTPMFDQFERNEYKGRPLALYKFMVGGQICVDKGFRGRGLLRKLYHATRDRLPPGYELCVTEIAAAVADWWNNRRNCDECERDKWDKYCYPAYLADIATCGRRHGADHRMRLACEGSAAVR